MSKINSQRGVIEISTIAAMVIVAAVVSVASVIVTMKYYVVPSAIAPIAVATPKATVAATPTPLVVTPTSTPVIKDETANWKTYTNTSYKFSFKYPAEFVSADASLRNETPDYLGRFGLVVNMLALSKSAYPKNTDLSRADILVAINRDVSAGEYFFQSVDKSQGVPPPEIEKLSFKKTITIDGITWGMAEKEGAAAGTHSRMRIYHTFQNGIWYEVQLNFWTASDGSIKSVNENDIRNKLESVLPTFKFTK